MAAQQSPLADLLGGAGLAWDFCTAAVIRPLHRGDYCMRCPAWLGVEEIGEKGEGGEERDGETAKDQLDLHERERKRQKKRATVAE